MKHASLAAHYRPQTFAEVTGQDMITTVLSRAAAEDRVAAAYLLSGTRGVGKTTIARILAKALNCVNAPTGEPCNQCANCQMITKGNHVDVTEIDGASNNSVEDARALRENIGYAPMEGRYKVFIIDEAHMLSRSAFNALLKTLEEPPPRVVFIFATTEVHKFPITIVSRCQHFIFKRLSEEGLVAHLSRVLTKEEVNFDPQAVRTIARRANGSVRDGMSLLGQTLALGESTLSMESTRAVLGLAGQELFTTLLEGIAREDCPAVMELMQKLCDQGIDMGFFLRELINHWRTLFLLREAGEAIIPSLALSAEESALWISLAQKFSAAHLHAAWHMTLDAQRKIIHSPEPAAALELLLVNLTLMPRLLPLQAVPAPTNQLQTTTQSTHEEEKKNSPELEEPQEVKEKSAEREAPKIAANNVADIAQAHTHIPESMPAIQEHPPHTSSFIENPPAHSAHASIATKADNPPAAVPAQVEHQAIQTVQEKAQASCPAYQPSWQEVQTYFAKQEPEIISGIFLQQVVGTFEEGVLHIQTKSMPVFDALDRARGPLQDALHNLCHYAVQIEVHRPQKNYAPRASLVEKFSAHPQLKDCLEILDATIYKVRPPNE